MKLEGAAGGTGGRGGRGGQQPRIGVWSISRWQWGTESSSKLCTCSQSRGDAREMGVLVLSGSKAIAGYTRKEPSGNPTGSHWHWEFGVSVGYGTNRLFPLLRRARRGAGEMSAMAKWQTAKILSRATPLIPGVRNAGMSLVRPHLDQNQAPQVWVVSFPFLLHQGTEGVQGTPWKDVLFTENHLKVFQLTEPKP